MGRRIRNEKNAVTGGNEKEKKLTLYPLSFDEAVEQILKSPAPPKAEWGAPHCLYSRGADLS